MSLVMERVRPCHLKGGEMIISTSVRVRSSHQRRRRTLSKAGGSPRLSPLSRVYILFRCQIVQVSVRLTVGQVDYPPAVPNQRRYDQSMDQALAAPNTSTGHRLL